MKESIFKQRLKGLMALTLAFMLTFGSSMMVFAAEYSVGSLTSVSRLSQGDKIVLSSAGQVYIDNVPAPVNSDSDSDSGSGRHIHDMQWIVRLQPTETQDGETEYRCVDERCGHIEARQPVSLLGVVVKKIIKAIEEAPENGTVVIDNQFLRCFSNEIVEALLARPDVTVDVRFTEKEVDYRFVIPAGKAPADEQEWYGYFYLGGLYGWQEPVKEEEIV